MSLQFWACVLCYILRLSDFVMSLWERCVLAAANYYYKVRKTMKSTNQILYLLKFLIQKQIYTLNTLLV